MLRWGEPTTNTSTHSTDFVGRPPPLKGLHETGKGYDPGLVNIDQDTGQIVAVPAEIGTYTMWLIAYIADPASPFGAQMDLENVPVEYNQVVLAVWEFEVVEQQDFLLQDAAKGLDLRGTDVGLDSDHVVVEGERSENKPGLEGRVEYAIGSTIQFPGMNLKKEDMFLNPANNDFAKITFKRRFVSSASFVSTGPPGLWLVDTETGAMLANPTTIGHYKVQLLAVDGRGAEVEVRSWSFKVVEQEVFRVDTWEWNTNGIATIKPKDYVYRTKASATTGNPPKIYGVGGTYQFPQIEIPLDARHHAYDDITFTMDGAPDGVLIDPKSGYIKGTPTNASDTIQAMNIYAVNGKGEPTADPLQTILFDVREGPNGTHCKNGGVNVRYPESHTDFAASFKCDCDGTGYDGVNCEFNIAERVAKEAQKDAEDTAAAAAAAAAVAENAKAKETLKVAKAEAEAANITATLLKARLDAKAEATATAEQTKADKKKTSFTTGLAVGGAILLLLIMVAAVKYQQHRIAMRPVDFDTQFALMVSMGLIEPEQAKVQMKPREIRRKDLMLVKVIGSGAFGEVYKAQLDEMFTRSTPEYTVAAKTVLDAKSSPEAAREMLAEAGVMAAVGSHPNLVSLIGVITRGDPLVLILQFCAQGEVLGMLKKAAAEGEPITLADKMQMAREVAQGMTHLSKEHFIHRDLACRNVLCAEGMCKIADFGLSRGSRVGQAITPDEWTHANADRADRGETHEDYYKSTTGVFPVRWTAPEAMETLRFTPASDVWSFGIVVIELLVDGDTPYHGMSNPDVMNLTMSGGRHPKPPLCSTQLFAFLLSCWDADPSKRPTFEIVVHTLKHMHGELSTSHAPDANAARVEAATRDKMARGEAANTYAGFGDEDGGGGGAVLATTYELAQAAAVEAPTAPAHFYPATN
jgi:hypothetical protein